MDTNRHHRAAAERSDRTVTIKVRRPDHLAMIERLSDNPAKGIERLCVPKDRQQPHLPWPDAAVAKFRVEASPLERWIYEIGVGSVQRPSDWLQFTWGDYDGDSPKLRQARLTSPW